MKTTLLTTAGLIAGLTAFTILGCSEPQDTAPATTAAVDSQAPADSHDHGGGMAAMEKGLAKLSEADRASAMKQHVCPVTGEMLGTMGEPIKVSVQDQDVWVCCGGCTDKLKADPDKYLAKLTNGPDHEGHGDHGDHKEHAEGT